MLGCTNIYAENYNPAATQDDGSCVILFKHKDQCLEFSSYPDTLLTDKSFTLSYSVEGKSWVFFHDYIPDFYYHTREQLWSVKDQELFKHNAGPYGSFYNPNDKKSFLIDVVFQAGSDLILETVQWITEVIQESADNSENELEWSTLTHISIWNSQQHTGRIVLKDIFENLQYKTHRRTQGQWSFNDFRNILKERGTKFLLDIFNNYALDATQIDPNKPWYEKEIMEDKYFVIRFEFDNTINKQLILHDTTVEAIKSDR